MSGLSHTDEAGAARMVDVTAKADTSRTASATGRIDMNEAARAAIADGTAAKGDVFAAARIAGIMAAKRTSDIIPLCHPLPLTGLTLDLALDAGGATATATVRTSGKTGVEMEALTAVSAALLTLYDMLKAVDKHMVIRDIHVTAKAGGKSGDWTA
ncbi:cyclic pyranopterin phosphate synthase [Sphingobium sp. B2D3A]|uniref:cyclic pyranopterin monophosphate synthase MoaC n=1 Tax=unclassified Sphingobium TaxID=2611147 RepID=UPI0022251370|nr:MULTISPECIES: cyclic pyranopterin monophosphate synthase MoaC [unclassified Sphingobium]MCW2336957.1 cyclic pyranopterin phosphate synthase [Sphingobium sp. B2D3A]MCW2380844.1 cyclic pyranopterin phosphate synthase [Sphingobium sp. B2D3B]MCW2386710.1 cyclic pyranopterin phosphate synthase [Sphingobium sp. B2D3D]MCW2399049.1 cyclic pyranopterin phosphate synthase [Sphingobium sp. B2D3C]